MDSIWPRVGKPLFRHSSTKMGENNRFSFAALELSGFLVGEIASLDYSLSVFVGSVG